MINLTIMKKDSMRIALTWFEKINDALKSFGIVGGGVAASLADWILGGIFLSVLFQNYAGSYSTIVGWVFSMGLWGIQLILWQVIFSGAIGHQKKRGAKITSYVVVFVFIAVAKICDDIIDIAAVWWMLKDNPVQLSLSHSLYNGLLAVVFALTWVLTGFAEVFVSASIYLLKDGKDDFNRDNRGQERGQGNRKRGGQPVSNFGSRPDVLKFMDQHRIPNEEHGKPNRQENQREVPFPIFQVDDE